MSQLFDSYEQDYSNISESIKKKLNETIPGIGGEQRRTALRAVERELDEADEILQSMEMELNSFPPSTKSRLQPRLRNYRSDYEKLKGDFKKATNISEREQLLSGGNNEETYVSMDQRARLLQGTNKLNDASRRLEDSHRLALETEQIGVDTLGTLRNQRQQILHAHETMDEANSFIDRNIRILKDMTRRMATNRVLSIAIIIVLIFCIILLLILKFR